MTGASLNSTEVQEMIRVVVVDDHPAVRLGLADFLDAQDGIEIVGQAENGAQAVELSSSTDPDVVVMDIRMPESTGSKRPG